MTAPVVTTIKALLPTPQTAAELRAKTGLSKYAQKQALAALEEQGKATRLSNGDQVRWVLARNNL